MRRFTVASLVVLAAVVLSGCTWTDEDSLSATQGLPDVRQQLTAHTWLLDRADSTLRSDTDASTTLDFRADGTLAGSGACNSYRGSFTIKRDELHVGSIVQTRRACTGNANAADDEYLAALEQVRRVDATDRNALVLESSGVRLAFEALDTREAIAGTWTVTAVATDDAIVSVTAPEPALTIEPGGDLSLQGCNTMRGTWTLAGDRFDVGAVASTLIGCERAAAEQDAALKAALEDAASVSVSPQQLTVLAEDGRTLLIGVPEGS